MPLPFCKKKFFMSLPHSPPPPRWIVLICLGKHINSTVLTFVWAHIFLFSFPRNPLLIPESINIDYRTLFTVVFIKIIFLRFSSQLTKYFGLPIPHHYYHSRRLGSSFHNACYHCGKCLIRAFWELTKIVSSYSHWQGGGSGSAWICIHFPSWIRIRILIQYADSYPGGKNLHKLYCFLRLSNLLCFFLLKKTLHQVIFYTFLKLDPDPD